MNTPLRRLVWGKNNWGLRLVNRTASCTVYRLPRIGSLYLWPEGWTVFFSRGLVMGRAGGFFVYSKSADRFLIGGK